MNKYLIILQGLGQVGSGRDLIESDMDQKMLTRI
jgi:hypothetical protein